jgi:hypothetical protein
MSRYSDIILANASLAHYYRLGEASGNLADSKGSETMTPSGTVAYNAAGAIVNDSDGAFDTTGGTNGTAKTSSHTQVGGGASATLELWLKFTSTVTNNFVAGEASSSSTSQVFYIGIVSGKLRIFVRNNTLNPGDVQTTATYNDGNWHYVALVGDRTANTLNLYVDDVRGGSAANVAYPTGTYGMNQFAIGCLYRTTAGSFAPVVMDEVAMYTTALTTDQMYEHYRAGLGQFGSFF